MQFYTTTTPYETVDYKGIQYTVCYDYKHISRYKGLRQLIHNPKDADTRFVAPETANGVSINVDVVYYTVSIDEVNRLDLIANRWLGSPTYAWVIAYMNNIEDGFTVSEETRLKIPKSFFDLFQSGEILAPIPALQLNLLTE